MRSETGTPGGIRTPDLLIRSQTLYPTELLAQVQRRYAFLGNGAGCHRCQSILSPFELVVNILKTQIIFFQRKAKKLFRFALKSE
jgi:hypothetical protein